MLILGIHNVAICSKDGNDGILEANHMEENGTNIIENKEIKRLIHGTFVTMYEYAPVDHIYEDIHDVPLIDKTQNPYTKTQRKVFSMICCSWST